MGRMTLPYSVIDCRHWAWNFLQHCAPDPVNTFCGWCYLLKKQVVTVQQRGAGGSWPDTAWLRYNFFVVCLGNSAVISLDAYTAPCSFLACCSKYTSGQNPWDSLISQEKKFSLFVKSSSQSKQFLSTLASLKVIFLFTNLEYDSFWLSRNWCYVKLVCHG